MRRRIAQGIDALFMAGTGRWLAFAVTSSVVIVLLGSGLLYGIFAGTTPSAVAEEAGGEPASLTVLVGRTPGGPANWLSYVSALREVQQHLGVPVSTSFVSKRSEVVFSVRNTHPDIALVSIYQSIILREDGRYELLASPVVDGEALDSGVIAVRADSPYRTLEDLRGARIAIGPGNTLGGFGQVRWILAQRGATIEEFFGHAVTGAEHDSNLEKVHRGETDAAGVNRSQLASWPDGTFRIVAETPEFGMSPLVVRADLPETRKEAIQQALLGLKPGLGLPDDSVITGFRVPDTSEYEFAEQLIPYLDLDSVVPPEKR